MQQVKGCAPSAGVHAPLGERVALESGTWQGGKRGAAVHFRMVFESPIRRSPGWK